MAKKQGFGGSMVYHGLMTTKKSQARYCKKCGQPLLDYVTDENGMGRTEAVRKTEFETGMHYSCYIRVEEELAAELKRQQDEKEANFNMEDYMKKAMEEAGTSNEDSGVETN